MGELEQLLNITGPIVSMFDSSTAYLLPIDWIGNELQETLSCGSLQESPLINLYEIVSPFTNGIVVIYNPFPALASDFAEGSQPLKFPAICILFVTSCPVRLTTNVFCSTSTTTVSVLVQP